MGFASGFEYGFKYSVINNFLGGCGFYGGYFSGYCWNRPFFTFNRYADIGSIHFSNFSFEPPKFENQPWGDYFEKNSNNYFANIDAYREKTKTGTDWAEFLRTVTYKPQKAPAKGKGEEVTHDAKSLTDKWNKKLPNATNITETFCQKVIDISKEINCDPDDLMAVMKSESAGTFDPAIQNQGGAQAYGLIQFTEIAARDINKTLDEIKQMSAIEQLDCVKEFLQKGKNRKFSTSYKLTGADLYALVYLPGVADQEILATKANDPDGYYAKNLVLDVDNDEQITKTDLGNIVTRHKA